MTGDEGTRRRAGRRDLLSFIRRGAGHRRRLFAVSDVASAFAAVATPSVWQLVAIATARRTTFGRSRQRQQIRLARSGCRPPQPIHGKKTNFQFFKILKIEKSAGGKQGSDDMSDSTFWTT